MLVIISIYMYHTVTILNHTTSRVRGNSENLKFPIFIISTFVDSKLPAYLVHKVWHRYRNTCIKTENEHEW